MYEIVITFLNKKECTHLYNSYSGLFYQLCPTVGSKILVACTVHSMCMVLSLDKSTVSYLIIFSWNAQGTVAKS